MLTARRYLTTDDLGDSAEDFMAGDVVHAPKRRVGFDMPADPLDERIVRMEAVARLTHLGWSAEKIGVALGLTGRTVRNIRKRNRQIAAGVLGDSEGDDD